jgi:hypothetical protein
VLHGLLQRVPVVAASLDPRVDRDAVGGRSLLDRLEKGYGHAALARQRRVERQLQRHTSEEHRDERGLLGAREAQRGLESGE